MPKNMMVLPKENWNSVYISKYTDFTKIWTEIKIGRISKILYVYCSSGAFVNSTLKVNTTHVTITDSFTKGIPTGDTCLFINKTA